MKVAAESEVPDRRASSLSEVDRLLGELEHFGIKLGLERMRALLTELGNPEQKTPAILVAGTNGKGSTAALLASILTAASYRTGLFTSPHLERVEERIRIDGAAITSDRLAAELERVIAAAKAVVSEPITYFEVLTAVAFSLFESLEIDLAVFEVGLGGRLDATNVGDPVLSIITGIGFDHQRQLGETLALIAAEKAGVLRAQRPALTYVSAPEPAAVIRAAAGRIGAMLVEVPGSVNIDARREQGAAGQLLKLVTGRRTYDLRLRLGGRHQAENVSLAVCAAETLAEEGWQRVDRAAIERGVAACRWPGRLEWIRTSRGDVLLDAAHNGAGVASLAAYLSELGQPFTLLFGMLASKVDRAALRALFAMAGDVVLTAAPSPRGLSPQELARQVGAEGAEALLDPSEALAHALKRAGGDLVVVSGSIYLVGAVRADLRRRFGVPPAAERIFGDT